MAPAASRIRAVDWLRGLAVLFMLQTHAFGLLKPEHVRFEDPIYQRLVRVDGLVAPSFIFAAGFSLALVQIRGARSGNRGGQAKKSAKRIGEVFAVACLMNFIWFNFFKTPVWFLYVDILHCIALSLFIALPLMVAFAQRPEVFRLVMLALAAVVFGVSPFAEQVQGPLRFLVNSSSYFPDGRGSLFPLLPWAGYVFLGASLGATAALGDEGRFTRWLLMLLGIGATLWLFDGFFKALYPKHNFWVTNPANHGQRWTIVTTLVLGLRFVELKWARFGELGVVKFLSSFGTSSLSAYFFHLMLIAYGFGRYWDKAVDWPAFFGLVAVLTALTYGLVRVTEVVDPKVRAMLSRLLGGPP
jgi:uncharacterized membrane protein